MELLAPRVCISIALLADTPLNSTQSSGYSTFLLAVDAVSYEMNMKWDAIVFEICIFQISDGVKHLFIYL